MLNIGLVNPQVVVSSFDYHRAYKTDYEMHCLRTANRIAVTGHQVAKQAFLDKQSEYDIHFFYLKAIKHTENESPYSNIIALNNNGSILHYSQFDQEPPSQFHSFLIDAGANCNGYASDITRTYSMLNDPFSSLIAALNEK